MIKFDHVTKRFGSKCVLDDVSYEIAKGEVFCIVGPSGTGKSVSLKHMIRLLTPTSGEVWVGDDCVSRASSSDLPRIRSRFGYLFQSAALLAWMSVYENVALPLREKTAITESEIDEKVRKALDQVGLGKEGESYPSDLSGGMQKRAGLARALALDPAVVFLDEPTAGLDPIGAAAFDALIRTLQQALGLTVFLITHDLDSLYAICDRVAVLADRKVIAVAPVAELETMDHPWVQEYFNGPRGRAARG